MYYLGTRWDCYVLSGNKVQKKLCSMYYLGTRWECRVESRSVEETGRGKIQNYWCRASKSEVIWVGEFGIINFQFPPFLKRGSSHVSSKISSNNGAKPDRHFSVKSYIRCCNFGLHWFEGPSELHNI